MNRRLNSVYNFYKNHKVVSIFILLFFIGMVGNIIEPKNLKSENNKSKIEVSETKSPLKNIKEIKQTENVVQTPTPTLNEVEKETIYKLYAGSTIEYMTGIFYDIVDHCTNQDIISLKSDIGKLTKVKEEISKKETPERYENFKVMLIEIICHWEQAYNYVIQGDVANTNYHTTEANVVLERLKAEYPEF